MLAARHADTVVMTQTELAAALRVSARSFQRARAKGALPACVREIQVGTRRRYLLLTDGSDAASIPAALASIPCGKEGQR